MPNSVLDVVRAAAFGWFDPSEESYRTKRAYSAVIKAKGPRPVGGLGQAGLGQPTR